MSREEQLSEVIPTATEVVERVDELLEAKYVQGDLGNLSDPLAEAVFIVLSRQTQDMVYRSVFSDLRAHWPCWCDVLHAFDEDLIAVLKPAGFQRQRAGQIRALLDRVEDENRRRGVGPYGSPRGDLTLDFIKDMNDSEAEQVLLTLPGIGPKSARCVLAYSLDRSAFPVDTHVHRIFGRLGLVPTRGRKKDHDPFQRVVPPGIRKRLHINLVHHGRTVCRNTNPLCEECTLVSFCQQGRVILANDSRPVVVDLFAGAGGLGLGFRRAGFRVGLAVESEKNAAQTYRFNNPGVPVLETRIDHTTTAAELLTLMPGRRHVPVVLAGPPCQGYSMAGSRKAANPLNALYLQVVRLARELGAEAVCLENVPGLRRVGGHRFLQSIVEAFEAEGFAVGAHLLHACEFGVPQHRARYFFLCRKRDKGEAPQRPASTHRPCHDVDGDSESLPPTPDLRDILASIPALPSGVVAERYANGDGRTYLNMSTMAHSERVIAKISSIGSGEGPISYRRLPPDEAKTIIAGHRALPVHPELHRTISVREAALIQGFPVDYFFCGSRASQPLQVANAVPPPMAEAVARHLMQELAIPSDGGDCR
jgi:DNA (cytosine-5)-methyltransferase 1